MKKNLYILSAVLLLLSMVGCTRECHCYGRDGSHTYYTKEQLDEMDYNCSNMASSFHYGLYYSLCEWEL